MKTKTICFTAIIAVASAVSIAGWMRSIQSKPGRPVSNTALVPASATPIQRPPLAAVADALPSQAATPALPDSPPAARPGQLSAPAPRPPRNPMPPATAPARNSKPALQDPTARVAMTFVGADPDAEAYWLEAIFDSSLPDQEREDLMEDLNEEGLSDDKQPGPDDFPLIMNRIALLEAIASDADDFMLPHLQEAYQDLVNLAAITQGEGSPVQ